MPVVGLPAAHRRQGGPAARARHRAHRDHHGTRRHQRVAGQRPRSGNRVEFPALRRRRVLHRRPLPSHGHAGEPAARLGAHRGHPGRCARPASGFLLSAHRARAYQRHRPATRRWRHLDGPRRSEHGHLRFLHHDRCAAGAGRGRAPQPRWPGLRRLRAGDQRHGRGARHPAVAAQRAVPHAAGRHSRHPACPAKAHRRSGAARHSSCRRSRGSCHWPRTCTATRRSGSRASPRSA